MSRPDPGPDADVRRGGSFVCLNCGAAMLQRRCKVRCARCGYFEDCSDGGNDPTNYRPPMVQKD